MNAAALSALAALLELDATLVAQTMVSRPLVTGSLLGALSGSPLHGLALGAAFEALSLSDLPVGGALSWSATTAASVAALASGRGADFALCLLGGLAAGALHARLEAREREARGRRAPALAAAVAEGRAWLGAALARSVLLHFAWTGALIAACVEALVAFDLGAWAGASPLVRAAVSGAAFAAPWVGLSGAAVWCWRRA